MRRLTRWMPGLLVCALFLPARAVHAQGLSNLINKANEAMTIIIDIAKRHQLQINKDQLRPVVGTLQDDADTLQVNNVILQLSINSALDRTPNGVRVPDAYAERVVRNAAAVNRQNKSLADSLVKVGKSTKFVQGLQNNPALSQQEKEDVRSALNMLTVLKIVYDKENKITDITKEFGGSREPLTQAKKRAIKDEMSNAITLIVSVITKINSLYSLLDS